MSLIMIFVWKVSIIVNSGLINASFLFIFNFSNSLISKILNIYPSTPVWNKSKCNKFLDSLKLDVFHFTSCSINKCVSIDYFLKIWTLHPVRKCKIFLHVKILEIIKDIRKFSVDAGTPRVDFGCTLHSKLMHVDYIWDVFLWVWTLYLRFVCYLNFRTTASCFETDDWSHFTKFFTIIWFLCFSKFLI